MLQTLFAITAGFLNLDNLRRGLARGALTFRDLCIIIFRLRPTLSCAPIHVMDVPIAPSVLIEDLRTPSPSGGLIAIEAPPLALPSPIPTRSYQSSPVTVTSDRLPDLVPFLLLLVFISGFVLLLPGLVYFCTTIANRISAISRLSRKSISSLVPVYFFSTRIVSRHLIYLASLLLLWTGPPTVAAFFTLIYIRYIIFEPPVYQKFSNMIVNFLQRCGLLTPQDTQTPPVLNAIYEQIVNKTVTYHKLIWRRSPPAGPKQEHTPTSTDVVTSSRPDIQIPHRDQELLTFLAQHKLELEEEKQHRLRTQRLYSEFIKSKNSLRRELEVSRTREGELQADLLAAEAKRRKLKDRIATLEASDIALRADLTVADDGARDAAIMIDRQSRLAAEKDHVIRSTTKDLLAVRAELRDAEDKIAQLDAELQKERNLRIRREKELSDEQAGLRDAKAKIARLDAELQSERNLRTRRTKELLDEQTETRSLHEAEMRHIAKQAEDVQAQIDLLDYVLSQSRPRTRSLDDAHPPRLRNHTIAIEPDDTGQPPPPPLGQIPDAHAPSLTPVAKARSPFSPKSLRQTLEHDPPKRRSPDHPRQISACFDRISETADSWRARLESLLETIDQLEAERALEAEARELSELCLQEELAETKDQLGATQEELAATREQLRAAQEDASGAHREIDLGREALQETKAHIEDFKREMETTRVKLKEVQDARRAGIAKYGEAVELLRRRHADLESLRAEAEASLSKHSQAVSLSAVLRKRVTLLEAEVKSLNCDQKGEQTHPAATTTSPQSLCTASSSHHAIISLDNAPLSFNPPQRPHMSSTPRPPLPFRSGIPSSPSWTRNSLPSLPGGSSVDSVDWPPIGSTLRPSGKNSEQDSGVSKTPQSPRQEADHTSPASSTSRKPLNLPLALLVNSRPFVFGDWSLSTSAHGEDFLSLVRRQTANSTQSRPEGDGGETRRESAAAADTCVSPQGGHREPSRPFGSYDADGPMRLTTEDIPRSSLSASVICAHFPSSSSSHLHLEAENDCHHSALSSHTPLGSPPIPGGSIDAHALTSHSSQRSMGSSNPESRRGPSPLARLLPGLLDPVLLREHQICDDDSPCAFEKKRRKWRPYRVLERRPYIPTLDYGLPVGFIPGTGRMTPERPDRRLDDDFAQDFANLIPLDCVTSTPVALSRRLASKRPSPESDVKVEIPSFGGFPLSLSPLPESKRELLRLVDHHIPKVWDRF